MTDSACNHPEKVPYLPTEQTFAILYPLPEKSSTTSAVYFQKKRAIKRRTKKKNTTRKNTTKKTTTKRKRKRAENKKRKPKTGRKTGRKNKSKNKRKRKTGSGKNLFDL